VRNFTKTLCCSSPRTTPPSWHSPRICIWIMYVYTYVLEFREDALSYHSPVLAFSSKNATDKSVSPPRVFFFSFSLVAGPGRSLILKLSDTRVYEPQIRARLGTASHFCEVVVLKLRTVPGDGRLRMGHACSDSFLGSPLSSSSSLLSLQVPKGP